MAQGTVNKVTLVGRLGADPEAKFLTNGSAKATLRLATNDGYKDKTTGQFIESTEWHRVALFGKLAEIAGEYLTKGRLVYIEGKIKTRKWQDQTTGQDRYMAEVVAEELQMLGANPNAVAQAQQPTMAHPSQQAITPNYQPAGYAQQSPMQPANQSPMTYAQQYAIAKGA